LGITLFCGEEIKGESTMKKRPYDEKKVRELSVSIEDLRVAVLGKKLHRLCIEQPPKAGDAPTHYIFANPKTKEFYKHYEETRYMVGGDNAWRLELAEWLLGVGATSGI